MSPDPVISAIDSAIADHDELLASMARNAERFHLFGPAPEWPTATTRGWVPKVSPAEVRYVEPEWVARAFRYPACNDVYPDPSGGPVPSPPVEGSEPAELTVPGCHRARHPLRVWWRALASAVSRRRSVTGEDRSWWSARAGKPKFAASADSAPVRKESP